ncbi:type VI secretion system contractile sheath small subunit [Francisellaceae bacterium]|nr:type VI secretion system contractile sheath small subunit [Francisellaceae bacterium]
MSINSEIPKSRIMINYKTDVDGKPKDKELPMKFLVVGDLSGGNSEDRAQDLDVRSIRDIDGTLDSTMSDMNIKVDMQVENHIDPSSSPMLNVSLPIKSMKSFKPSDIAVNVPEIHALIKMRDLLKEFESTVDNNKAFRNTIKDILKDKSKIDELVKELPNIDTFKLESFGSDASKEGAN